jgi:hypothetical protein
MNEVAELAEKGKNALLEKNYKELANLMNRNFDLRRQVYTFHCVKESLYHTNAQETWFHMPNAKELWYFFVRDDCLFFSEPNIYIMNPTSTEQRCFNSMPYISLTKHWSLAEYTLTMKYLTCIFRFFVRLLGKTFRQMFGGEALGALNIKMVDVARSVGAAAKFTGSGGAVVAFCPDGPTQVSLLESECKNAGFTFEKISVVPSFLSEDESKPLKIC